MRQLVAALVVALAALSGFVRPLAPPAPAAAATGEPKVVIIVGATHGATESYRQKADVEYNHVLQYTSNVVRIYSPNATWSAVKAAIAGASIVIYHGHGNGWPSPYTYDPNYTTKNGFGLNSSAGQGDNNNKYYGEPSIETLDPAPNAIVLLHNLCYAAGNSEPGHADPSESVARQRADNYASAFLRAGFGAVIAGGHENAVPYLDALFTSDQTVDEMWRNSWTSNGNTFTFASGRTPGATVAMDPESPGKYYRAFTTTDLDLRTGDVVGDWAPPPPLEVDPSAYQPIAPERVLDTRIGTGLAGTFATGKARSFQVAGVGSVPAEAVAVTGNVTVTGQTSAGYVSLGPVKVNAPTTSTLNFPKADVRANGVTVPLGADGTIAGTFVGAAGSKTHLVFDVTGYFLEDPLAGAAYVPIAPERLLDTRAGTGLAGTFQTGVARHFAVAGVGAVPADAIAITGNLTVVGQTSAGYVSLGPVKVDAPTTSTLNFPKGDVRANGVTVPLSAKGNLAATFIGAAGAKTHLVLDVTGYFVADPAAGAVYLPINPARVLDTRSGTGLLGAFRSGTARTFAVAGLGAVPENAIAVTGNLTVVGQTTAGYVSLGPTRTDSPTTSTLNFPRADVRANGVTVPLSAKGDLSAVFKGGSGALTHLVFDVTGYFLAAPAAGSLFQAVDPARILDTRSGLGLSGAFAHGAPRQFAVAGVGPVPAGTIAITGNLTVTGQTSDGYVALGPLPALAPTTSTLNMPRGDIRANNVTVPLGPDGTLSATFRGAAGSSAHLVLDITGYLVGGPVPDWLPGPDDTWWVPVPDGATRLPAVFRFAGGGWGHGVGMSQYGALGRAQAGQTAADILAHYYRDTTLGAIDPLAQVRVLVLAGHQPTDAAPLRIVGRGGPWTIDGGPGPFPADATLAVRPPVAGTSAWRYRVTAADATVLHDASTTDRVRVYPGDGARLELLSKLSAYDEYRGVLRVVPSGSSLSVVNEVGIDAYLAGVVPVEMPSSWPAEALRAQAIAARSFAAHRLRPGIGTYDLFDDTRSQVYRGILAEKATTNAAIAATGGVVVLHAGAPANTLFHSTGGGATEHNENAFVSATGKKVAGPLPYLRGSPDVDPVGAAYDAASPYAAWQTGTYPLADVSAWFRADARTNVGTLVALDLRDRGVSGRLISVTLIGTEGTKTVSGDVFRAVFNGARPAGSPLLRANAFAVVAGG